MRVEIITSDRLGISQEILTAVTKLQWNLTAMEVATGRIFLNLDVAASCIDLLHKALLNIVGYIDCKSIDLLPTESREQHLNALLKRIPDPIFDVDEQGNILSHNQQGDFLSLQTINEVLTISLESLKSKKPFTTEVVYKERNFIGEVTPIWSELRFNGAVVILKSVSHLGRQMSLLQQGKSASSLSSIIGESNNIKKLKQLVVKFSALDLPVLISGETGTGKELFARAMHEQSKRKGAPFLAINCASLSEHLLESELFGYVSGAFTGAGKNGKPGLFELANGGTVFLDEVAEMSVYLQAKLLRFLQDYSFRRLGGTKEISTNVRIISASHQPFNELLEKKDFREDLYYRLNVLNLELPALQDRITDIPILVRYFLKDAAKQVNLLAPEISESAIRELASYSWPGNIRQLQNVMFRIVALNTREQIDIEDVREVLNGFERKVTIDADKRKSWLTVTDWDDAQSTFERSLLTELYPLYPSTRKLAQRLNVSHNKVAMKLRKLAIEL